MNIEEIIDNPAVIMVCRFGSKLYGTDSVDSDTDYKALSHAMRVCCGLI